MKSLQARRHGRSDLWILLLVVLLLAALALFACWQYRQNRLAATAQSSASSAIDHGLIYAGQPRPLDPALHVQVLQNTAYVVGYSNERKDPLWVAYRLFRVANPVEHKRPPAFSVDDRTTARVASHDYTGTGYSRGHMAPNHALDTHYGPDAQRETFLMSNIVPQFQALNAGVWEALERDEDGVYANRYEQVWIIDGPLFDDAPPTLPAGVAVPKGFYKILVREVAGRPEFLPFIVPQPPRASQVPRDDLPRQHLTSVKEIERQAHFDFFWQVPQPVQDETESVTPAAMW